MITFDLETCGLFGMPVLLQYGLDDEPVQLYDIWTEPAGKTLQMLEWIASQDVCGFNIVFDWFHMCKLYTTLHKFARPDAFPIDHINELAEVERDAWDGPCLKPKRACDLFLHARKGPFQSLMARKDIKISRIPTVMAPRLIEELEARIKIDDIYFSRRHDKNAKRWNVYDTDSPDFKNIILKFAASSGLKVLAKHVLKVDESKILTFGDVEVERKWWPKEKGWAPYALAVSSLKQKWRVYKGSRVVGHAWPAVINRHISHWAYYEPARRYAGDDVRYTRGLWLSKEFGQPEPGDDDSELACMVAAVRWHGMRVDIPAIKKQRDEALKRIASVPLKPSAAREYIGEVMTPREFGQFKSTKKLILQSISEDWKCDCQTTCDLGEFGVMATTTSDSEIKCERCGGSGVHPAAPRAKEVITGRKAKKEIETYDKISQARRFYPSFVIIGTLSSRMAGTDGLNAQGINRRKDIRDCFKLADPGFRLCGGDFDAFEVVLADAAYDDEALRQAITTIVPCARCEATGALPNGKQCDVCDGSKYTSQKIHALFAMELYPGKTYDDIVCSKGCDPDMYSIGKAGVFAMIYGGDWSTLVKKNGIPEHVAKPAEKRFVDRFPGIKRAREIINQKFCSMTQPGGLSTKVVWADPAEKIESLFGFPRYFTLENLIVKELFTLANNIPASWKDVKIKFARREGRLQTASGACSSALYGAAFGIQGQNMRAAANHVIQSSGATITKKVQRRVWDMQPCGANPWKLYAINIHDELMICALPEIEDDVGVVVTETVESFRPRVPLIKFEFQKDMASWASK